jgi:hypothetical protein
MNDKFANQNYLNGFLCGSVATLLAFCIGVILYTVESDPTVHFSWSTEECVEVINYNGSNYTCDNLPDRYNHVWVK